ncbi:MULTISPECIES: hypothetical protein [Pseudoalteromonas]|uniref:Uncharacterized protein n=1 Tax=Pseudoalteromonas amylolytica TaxID=1859457 RepID=A0A1S1MXU1_9GAMM|nr:MULTISPECIES: hypothetical protein [Pseudoalteromonas]OHU85527.1 hypothetical protein BFC16_19455 [Pseudoalteromonas sp. JW3]OHU91761.1 hypothetical protein BET10_08150 [Pseudoalteromonas amylolytica]
MKITSKEEYEDAKLRLDFFIGVGYETLDDNEEAEFEALLDATAEYEGQHFNLVNIEIGL